VLPSLLVEFCDGIDAGPEEDHGVLQNFKTNTLSIFFFYFLGGIGV
jgi:hypothetical protein